MQNIISNTKSIKIVIAQHVLACTTNFLNTGITWKNVLEIPNGTLVLSHQ